MCVHVCSFICACHHSMHMQIRGVHSCPPLHGIQGLNSGYQASKQVSKLTCLLAKLILLPHTSYISSTHLFNSSFLLLEANSVKCKASQVISLFIHSA